MVFMSLVLLTVNFHLFAQDAIYFNAYINSSDKGICQYYIDKNNKKIFSMYMKNVMMVSGISNSSLLLYRRCNRLDIDDIDHNFDYAPYGFSCNTNIAGLSEDNQKLFYVNYNYYDKIYEVYMFNPNENHPWNVDKIYQTNKKIVSMGVSSKFIALQVVSEVSSITYNSSIVYFSIEDGSIKNVTERNEKNFLYFNPHFTNDNSKLYYQSYNLLTQSSNIILENSITNEIIETIPIPRQDDLINKFKVINMYNSQYVGITNNSCLKIDNKGKSTILYESIGFHILDCQYYDKLKQIVLLMRENNNLLSEEIVIIDLTNDSVNSITIPEHIRLISYFDNVPEILQ